MFLTVVHLFYAQEQIAHIALHSFALCVKELLELFAPVALYKRMKVQIAQKKSESANRTLLLTKNGVILSKN